MRFYKAFRMRLRENCLNDYERAHNPIPSDLMEVMRDNGVKQFCIFHDPGTLDLFALAEIEDEQKFASLAQSDICRNWWKRMTKYLVCESPDDIKAIEIPLREVFRFQ